MNPIKFSSSPVRSGKASSVMATEHEPDLMSNPQTEAELSALDRWRLWRVRSTVRSTALIEQVQAEEQACSEVRQHILENGKAIKMGEITQSAARQQSDLFRDCNQATAASEKRLQEERYNRTKEHVFEYEQERRALQASAEAGDLSPESVEFLEAQKRNQMVNCIDNDQAATDELVRHQRQLGRWAVSGFEVPPDGSSRR